MTGFTRIPQLPPVQFKGSVLNLILKFRIDPRYLFCFFSLISSSVPAFDSHVEGSERTKEDDNDGVELRRIIEENNHFVFVLNT